MLASGKHAGNECTIEKLSVKFEVFERAYVIRKQFLICLSYAINVLKSQNLSLRTALEDVGNSMFECGQIYVVFSRVTSLESLHLVNFDPSAIKAKISALINYDRLIKTCRQ